MNEETASDKPKATPKTRSPKAPATSAAADKKTASASTGEKKTPAVRTATKPTPAEPAEKPSPVRRRTASPKASAPAKPNPEERYRMVQAAAYFIAEKEGFQGCSIEYWHRAEREIAQKLGEAGG